MIRDVVATGGFVTFAAAGLVGAWRSARSRRQDGPSRSTRIAVLVGFAMSMLAGLSRRELWPFATWALIPDIAPATAHIRALVCADAAGTSFAVDHRAWSPLTEEELLAWVGGPYERLSAAQQDSARAILLRMAEASRRRVRAGGSASARPSLLGPLAAASHLKHPDLWDHPAQAPRESCIALHLVERSWNLDSLAAGRSGIRERVIWEYRP